MTWTTATTDLRTLLSDNSTDRYRYRKRVLGLLNGTNKNFKTFEFRRISNFTSAASPLGVYLNDALLTSAAFTSDDPATGEFVLVTAPIDGNLLEATYYIQWFLDAELTTFLTSASQWLGSGSTYANVADGLRPSALKYSAAEGYQKMALRWSERMSETFRMEDSPDPNRMSLVDEYLKAADTYRKEAVQLRDHFYTRQGQSLSPLFGVQRGSVRDPVPRR